MQMGKFATWKFQHWILRSAQFYEKVFGWNIREDNTGNISFDDTVGQVSGMWVLDREPTKNASLLISIMVFSVIDTLKLIVENEGQIVQAPNEADSEVVAKFSDSAGNLFSLYQDQQAKKH